MVAVAPSRERVLKPLSCPQNRQTTLVAPSRERVLKQTRERVLKLEFKK